MKVTSLLLLLFFCLAGDICRAASKGTVRVAASPIKAGVVTGAGKYPVGQVIQIMATPNTNWTFKSWQDGSVQNPLTYVVQSGTHSLVASFTINPPATTIYGTIALAAEPANGGTTSGSGTYQAGQLVTISAIAAPNFIFNRWHDGDANPMRSVTVATNTTVLYTATFISAQGSISVSPSPPDGGITSGSGTYPVHTQVNINAIPNLYWRFISWSDGITTAFRTISVQAGSWPFVANFQNYGTIMLTAEPSNAGTVSGSGTYPVGQMVTINAVPGSTNWVFGHWQDGSTTTPRQVSVASGPVQFTATFNQWKPVP